MAHAIIFFVILGLNPKDRRMADLTFIYSVMGAGKSAHLLQNEYQYHKHIAADKQCGYPLGNGTDYYTVRLFQRGEAPVQRGPCR